MRKGVCRKFLLASGVAGLLILGFGASVKAMENRMWQEPVLLHVFADTGCACGDYHAEVTGLVIRNPFRDHTAENQASRFFDDLRSGRCTIDDAVCEYALVSHRVSDWQLINRHDHGERVELYYKLTEYGVTKPKYRLTGEGLVELARIESGWSVVGYSAYF